MQVSDLHVKRRTLVGKKAKTLLKKEIIPAVLYFHGTETVSIEVPKKQLFQLISGHHDENVLVNVIVDGQEARTALINEIQTDPVTDEVIHVDFKGIAMDEKLEVRIAVHPKGEAAGVKQGGILDHIHREVHVRCLPKNIPSHIEVSIEHLEIAKSVYVRDVKFPEGVECMDDPDLVLLTVVPPMKVEEAPAAAETAVVAEGADAAKEPEVIKKGKKEEEGEEGEAKKPEAKKPEAKK